MSFDPSQLTGLTLWSAARKETGFNDGDAVGTMANAGSATAFTASGANRATFKVAGQGGRPYYQFQSSGPTEYAGAAMSSYITASAFAAWFVVEFITINVDFVVDNWYRNDCLFEDNNGFVGLTYGQTANLVFGVYDGSQETVAIVPTTSSWHIIHARLDSGFVVVSMDGGGETASGSGNIQNITATAKIGRTSTYTNPMTANLAEVIITSSVPTSTDRTNVVNYLKAFYSPAPGRRIANQAVNRAAAAGR